MLKTTNEQKLVTDNIGLINMAVKKYLGFGVDYDDLFQIGAVGLVKAAKAFDSSKNLRFSTYAVTKIVGEIKTYLRDNGEIKVPRNIKEQKFKIHRANSVLLKELGREPKLSEIAEYTGISTEDIIYALDATQNTVSLDIPPDEGGVTIGSSIQEDNVIEKIMISQLLATLPPDERKLIVMRYFADKTQSEISKELGLTQVQVSRLEKKILSRLKELLS